MYSKRSLYRLFPLILSFLSFSLFPSTSNFLFLSLSFYYFLLFLFLAFSFFSPLSVLLSLTLFFLSFLLSPLLFLSFFISRVLTLPVSPYVSPKTCHSLYRRIWNKKKDRRLWYKKKEPRQKQKKPQSN